MRCHWLRNGEVGRGAKLARVARLRAPRVKSSKRARPSLASLRLWVAGGGALADCRRCRRRTRKHVATAAAAGELGKSSLPRTDCLRVLRCKQRGNASMCAARTHTHVGRMISTNWPQSSDATRPASPVRCGPLGGEPLRHTKLSPQQTCNETRSCEQTSHANGLSYRRSFVCLFACSFACLAAAAAVALLLPCDSLSQ